MYEKTLLFISKPSQFSTFLKATFSLLVLFIFLFYKNIFDPIMFFAYSGIFSLIGKGNIIDLYNYNYFILLLFLVPFIITVHSFLKIHNTTYYFNNERLVIEKGILNKSKSYIEYFRIRDYNIKRPLIARILNRCNVTFITTDRTHKVKTLKLVNNFYQNEQKIRDTINRIVTETGRGREVDVI